MSSGYHTAWLVSAGIVLVTLGITAATLRPRLAAAATFDVAAPAEEAA